MSCSNRIIRDFFVQGVHVCLADARQKTASNRLIDEKSPYLIQHAGNPVNWYPWEAAAMAMSSVSVVSNLLCLRFKVG